MTFNEKILSTRSTPLTAKGIEVLQVNLGYQCNMACRHCHVAAGPDRKKEMERDTMDTALGVMAENDIAVLDVTGGAPELNPNFRYLVEKARTSGFHVVVRTNLTIFFEEGMNDLPDFYEGNGVELIASLPHCTEGDVDRVRGKGTFQKSIEALRKLNSLGYGVSAGRKINLVHNPAGAFLPPPQKALERDYRKELQGRYGVFFDELYAFANMPIGRFRDYLIACKSLGKYVENLADAFNPATLGGLMCRYLVNVGWDGALYDCDFNQMLGLNIEGSFSRHISNFDYRGLSGRKITMDEHCYGCTAGQGST